MDNTQILRDMQEQLKTIKSIEQHVRDIDSKYTLSILSHMEAASIHLEVAYNSIYWLIIDSE